MLGVMLWLTTVASLERGVLIALEDLWSDLWFRATLADAYFAFLIIYLWVAWRERSWFARAIWFVAFMGLGSIGIAIYVLSQLLRSSPADPHGLLRPRRGEGLRQ